MTKGRYVFSWGGRAGASEGRVISESEHQKGRAIPHVSYSREGHTSFPEFFNENFCDVAFHFSYRLSFSFHLLWFNLVFYYRYYVTFLHVYYAMAHSFSRRTRVLLRPYREVLDSGIVSSASCCWLSAAWSPESFSSEELLVDPTMRSTLSEMLEIFVFERQISHAKQIDLSVQITNSSAG